MFALFERTGLSFERLKTFCQVVNARGISQAAPGDPNRQSQFSRQIKELEEFFGARLVQRKRGSFELTSAGNELFAIAESHFRALENLLQRETGGMMNLRIVGGESLLHGLVLAAVPRLLSRYPGMAIELANCRTEEVLERLREGRADFGLMVDVPLTPWLQIRELGTAQLGLYVPAGVRTANKGLDPYALLRKLPLAALAGSRFLQKLIDSGKDNTTEIQVALRGSSYAQVMAAAELMGGVALVPDFFIEPGKRGSFIPLRPQPDFRRHLQIGWAKRSAVALTHDTGLVDAMIEQLRVSLYRKTKSSSP